MNYKDFIDRKIKEEPSKEMLQVAFENIKAFLLIAPKLTYAEWNDLDKYSKNLFLQAEQEIEDERSTALAVKIKLAQTPEGYARLIAPYDNAFLLHNQIVEDQIAQIMKEKKAQYEQKLAAKGGKKINQTDYIKSEVERRVKELKI